MTFSYQELGKRIQSERKRSGYTQEWLSYLVGCNPSHISNIENGRTKLSLETLVLIANALKVSVDTLLRDQYDEAIDPIDEEIMHYVTKQTRDMKEIILRVIRAL